MAPWGMSAWLSARRPPSGARQPTASSKATKANPQSDVEVELDLKLKDALLWSPSNPNLYEMITYVLLDGEEIDKRVDKFGIREFTFKDRQLYVNGEKIQLRGVNRHQEYPYIGYALSDNAQYRDAKKIKEAGFNCIRLSHYPHSQAFMNAC